MIRTAALAALFAVAASAPARAQEAVELLQEEVRGLAELVFLQRRYAETELEVGRAVREEAAIIAALARAERLFAERERGLLRVRDAVRARLRVLARGGRRGLLMLLLDSKHLADFRKRRRGLARSLRADVSRILAYRTELQRVAELRAEVEGQKARAAALREGVVRRRDELEKLRDQRESMLAELRRRGAPAAVARARGVLKKRLARLVRTLRSEAARARSPRALRGRLPHPVEAPVAIPFGPVREAPFGAVTMHAGWRYGGEVGAFVRAIHPGKIVFARRMKGYGNLVIVDHGGLVHSLSAHLREVRVREGQRVGSGHVVGLVGETPLQGAGLYFEIRAGGVAVDPARWLTPRGDDVTNPRAKGRSVATR